MAEIREKDRVREQFSRTAKGYVESQSHGNPATLTELVELLQPQPSWRILDVATGGGHVAGALAGHVRAVVASDLTPDMLAAARKQLTKHGIDNVEYVVADAEDLPFLDATFDAVTCRIAPHHFPEPARFVRESYRVLKPGGLFLMVDNVSPEDGALAEFLNAFEKLRDNSHVRCRRVSEWQEWLQSTGFVVQDARLRRKVIAFGPWVLRMARNAQHAAEVERFIGSGPDSALAYFEVRPRDGSVESLAIDEWRVLCHKPLVNGIEK